jgi:PAS domain S-box-containing protein
VDDSSHTSTNRPAAPDPDAAPDRPGPSREGLERQVAHLKTLYETSLRLVDRLERRALLEEILDRATELTGTEHGFVYLLNDQQTAMKMRVGRGLFNSQLGLAVKPGQGFGGRVWATARPLLVKDYSSWPGRLTDPSLDCVRAVLGIPLRGDKAVVGVIAVAVVNDERVFGREEINLMTRFAELALVALHNAGLYEELRRELAERKRTEANLRESDKRYSRLLEASADPIVVYDMRGRAQYVNPAFAQTFGWRSDELIGRTIEFVPEDCWPETREAIEEMLSGQKIRLFETQRLTKDGRRLDIQLSSTLYTDRDGQTAGNIVILRDITARKKAERKLQTYHDQLEELVAERTAELAQEVEDRRQAQMALSKREAELEAQSLHLAEVNTALKVLLKQREEDKQELEENVLNNVKDLVLPYLQRLNKARLNADQLALVNILESNLSNIVSPFISRLSSPYYRLTPMEIRVANLVKNGKTNKEIAETLFLSKNTVLFHRYNIRTKLGIKNKKINLTSHLLSFDR